MAGLTFSKDIKIVGVLSALDAAASADRDCKVVDTLGFNGCCFVYYNGTMAASATTALSVSRSNVVASATSLTGGEDIAGTLQNLVAADDDVVRFIDIAVMDDTERYLLLKCDKNGSNNSNETCVAFLYNGSESPVTHGDGTGNTGGTGAVTGEFSTTTAEGTA